MGLSGFIALARSIKRLTLGANIREAKLIAVIFKVSFDDAYVLAMIVSLKPCNNLINYFVFSELDLVCLIMNDE